MAIKQALIVGLMASGCTVYDIGLALSPMAYFAQFALDVPGVAMVTASHNDNGWTGVKMGCDRPLTFGPEEMAALKEIVLGGTWETRPGGGLVHVGSIGERYLGGACPRRQDQPAPQSGGCLRQWHGGRVCAAADERDRLRGGAARLRARLHLPALQSQSRRPQDAAAIAEKVRDSGADVGIGFDGDGDRCGVVDNEGNEIFADKIGVMLARDMSSLHPGALRRRCKIDRIVRDRSGAQGQWRGDRLLENRPFLYEAAHQ